MRDETSARRISGMFFSDVGTLIRPAGESRRPRPPVASRPASAQFHREQSSGNREAGRLILPAMSVEQCDEWQKMISGSMYNVLFLPAELGNKTPDARRSADTIALPPPLRSAWCQS